MQPSLVLAFFISFFFAVGTSAESHTIQFVNQCGYGTPALMYNGNNVLNGNQYTSSGPFSGIAYLQTGYCNTNGENCTLMEMTLINPTCAGCGSSADISLISPHVYNVETSFSYYNGCDGVGQTCASPNCTQNAFFVPTDNFVQKECQAEDVNLLISFCVEASGLIGGSNTSPTTANAPTSTVASATPNTQPAPTPNSSTASHSSATSSSTVSSTPTAISAVSTGKQCTVGSRRKRQANPVLGGARHRRHAKSPPHQA
ncbi:hypothetical protein EV401DRAFT_1576069 [Pisolithus croceorrhizus]|nr:hypothetical protein EV401DRAFT_1576069 [Pisolithus croceorrhizus]